MFFEENRGFFLNLDSRDTTMAEFTSGFGGAGVPNSTGGFNSTQDSAGVSKDLFEKFLHSRFEGISAEADRVGFCKECGNAMSVIGSTEYRCDCGYITEGFEKEEHGAAEGTGSAIRVTSGGKTRYYSAPVDQLAVQHKSLQEHMAKKMAAYAGPPFRQNIVASAVAQYNKIQRAARDDTSAGKKFLRRGAIKDEMLAAIIYYECIREGVARRKADVAALMHLQGSGFSQGESIVRELVSQGIIDLPIDQESPAGYVRRYLDLLNIDEKWEKLVVDLYEISNAKRIGTQALMTTRIVAFIWLLIEQLGLKIDSATVEAACDNIRANTFRRYCEQHIWDRINVFAPALRAADLPWQRQQKK